MASSSPAHLVRRQSSTVLVDHGKQHTRVGSVVAAARLIGRLGRQNSAPLRSGGKADSADDLAGLSEEDLAARRAEALRKSHGEVEFFVNNSCKRVLKELAVDRDKGLSLPEASTRLAIHGRNELTKAPPKPFWKLLLEQFSDLLVIMLMVAALISLALGQYAAGIVIWLIIIANAILGVKMEASAGSALDALEDMAAPLASVVRGGQIVDVDARELVPGDIVRLELGASIPADLRLLTTDEFVANEMALTGESEGVHKDAEWVGEEEAEQGGGGDDEDDEKKGGDHNDEEKALTDANMCYLGCSVQNGRALGVVVKTGMRTRMGEIAHLLNTAESGGSPLQQKLHDLGVKLGLASVAVSLLVFVVGVSTDRGTDPTSSDPAWLQMLLVSVSLTVAAVPEGLPAAVTITLAMGMRNMVRKNALIRDLHSVETLGSASVICSDKTGTLTAGVMTAVRLWHRGTSYTITGTGYSPHGFVVPPGTDTEDEAATKAAGEELLGGAHTVVLVAALCCSNAELQYDEEARRWEAIGNMSERPIVVAGRKAGLERGAIAKLYPRVAENPFSSARKMMSVVVDSSGKSDQFQGAPYCSFVKGAPNVVLDNCDSQVVDDAGGVAPLADDDRAELLAQVDEYSSRAYRVLAVAYRPMPEEAADGGDAAAPEAAEQGLTLLGFLAYIDPERPEVKPAIRKAHSAGIRVVMITGDYRKTAKAIGESIGLLERNSPESKAVDCEVVRRLGLVIDDLEERAAAAEDDAERGRLTVALEEQLRRLDDITAYADVYARAKPVDKITIVRSLQRQGNVCSMTGDGVNDAPALKQADIGVAMGIAGTDVAKGAASMVLTDDSFATIVAAVEEGRTVYANIQKFVFYLLSTNVSEVLFVLIAILMGLQTPLATIQILWLNLTTDGLPAIALAVEATEPGIMQEGARPKTEPILERIQLTGIAVQTVTLTTTALSTYVVCLQLANDFVFPSDRPDGVSEDDAQEGVRQAQTATIYFIVFAELLRAYGSRSLRQSVFSIGVFSNRYMEKSVGASVLATLFVGHVPGLRDVFGMEYLTFGMWMWIIFMSWVPFAVDEATKYVYRATGFGYRPRVRAPHAIEEDLKEAGGIGAGAGSETEMGDLEADDSSDEKLRAERAIHAPYRTRTADNFQRLE